MKQVVLVKPPNDLGPEHHSLFGLCCLAGILRKHGVYAKVVNADADAGWKATLRENANQHTIVGIQALTTEVAGAIEASDIARNAGAKVIWGGIHAQLFPEQVVADSSIDYVCTGEGESTITCLALDKPLEEVPNLAYKTDKIHFTEREPDDMAFQTRPAFDLVEGLSSPWMNRRRYQYQSSRGCPHRCGFCQVPILERGIWRHCPAERVWEDFEWMQSLDVKVVEFVDDNPFVNPFHMEKIANGLIARKSRIRWAVNCRADYISTRLDQHYLRRLVKAGLSSISIGAESGSQRMLDVMTKDVRVSDITQAAQEIAQLGIDSSFSFFFGLKDETVSDVRETIIVFDELKRIMPKLRIGVNIFTPYPGCALSKGLVREPTSLREWLKPEIRAIYSDRFSGKPWHNDPSFYTQLAEYCGMIYSPARAYKPSRLGLRRASGAEREAWEWIHQI